MINKLFKDKKKRYRNLVLILLPFVILMGIFGFAAFKSAKGISNNVGGEVAFSNSIDTMDYHLRANATDYQKELFKELDQAVKDKDKEKIAECVAKNYIADFYTWTNKSGSYDVGGMYYVYSPNKGNIVAQARSQFYKYLSTYIKEYGSENLLEVIEVTAEGGKSNNSYTLNDKSYDMYYYVCDFKYNDSTKLNLSDFDTHLYISVIENEDGRFEIVQCYGDH